MLETLFDVLNYSGSLKSGIKCHNLMGNEFEVYGYINPFSEEDLKKKFFDNYMPLGSLEDNRLESEAGIFTHRRRVSSNYLSIYPFENELMPQTTEYMRQKDHFLVPIFKTLKVAEEEGEYNLKDLYVPSLVHCRLYADIRSRHYKIPKITESRLRASLFPDNIYTEDGCVKYKSGKNDVLMFDRHGNIGSITDDIFNVVAICMCVHSQTKEKYYFEYNLTDIYTCKL